MECTYEEYLAMKKELEEYVNNDTHPDSRDGLRLYELANLCETYERYRYGSNPEAEITL